MTKVPSIMPILDMACGMASTPAPTIVLTRLITEDSHDAFPATPFSFLCVRRDGSVEAGREGACSLGTELIAAYEAMVCRCISCDSYFAAKNG